MSAIFEIERPVRFRWMMAIVALSTILALAIWSIGRIGFADPMESTTAHFILRLLKSVITMPEHFHSMALLVLAGILLATRTFGKGAEMLGFPAVLGEICVGLIISPALLGGFFPEALSVLKMPSVAGPLGAVSDFGIIMFLFVVGLEFDEKQFHSRMTASAKIALPGLITCMAASVPVSYILFHNFGSATTPLIYSLFIGLAMSITALPVLVRMLEQRGMARSDLGQIAICSATIDDIAGWGLLAVITALSKGYLIDIVRTVLLLLCYMALVLAVVRPLARTVYATRLFEARTNVHLPAVILVLLLSSAAATEWVGVHALFGAFVAGLVIPASSRLARDMRERIYPVAVSFFLPIYFVYTGSRVVGLDLGQISFWLATLLVVVVAFSAKSWGSYVGARWAGMTRRDAWRMGLLLNNRGLMELVVLNIGLDLNAISPSVFTMFVIMTIATTAMSCLLGGLKPDKCLTDPKGALA